jgi:hypothetical protein
MPLEIANARQRAAVAAAAQAATIIRNRLRDAALIELAREDSPPDGVVKYQLLNVWSGGGWFVPSTTRWLWSAAPDHDGHHVLRTDEVRQVEAFLKTAGDTEPYLFKPGEPASGVWHLDIDAVLSAYQGDAAAQ